jgi:putative flavoprotein involved in K+ transport
MTRDVDVAIVGAGQAGLATSWHLTQAGVEHVVLEAGRVAETWRSRRWDSFCLVTPNWGVELPGARYDGPDPDGYMPLGELIDYFGAWATSFHAPVREHVTVSALEQDGSDFILTLPEGKLSARSVVVATGGYQRAHRPPGADKLPRGVHQILAEDYRNPDDVPPGAVLVVGSGQTGCQLALELHRAGRPVFLACGRAPWTPRRFEGRDFVAWSSESGWLDRPAAALPSPAARLVANVQASGNHGGRDLNYRTLHGEGVELLGRYAGAEGSVLHFADDLATSVDFGDARLQEMLNSINSHCAATGRPPLEFEFPEPLRIRTRAELDVVESNIQTVIWTSGYRPAYGWIKLPIFDDMGFPMQTDGCSTIPGLYFMGVPWLRKFKSAILYGVGEDAQVVTRKIIESRA